MNHEVVRSNTRYAGDLIRYHEWPTHRQQTVAEHSWNVARIWLTIFYSDPNRGKILTYILFHDCGELGVGDIPFPVKKDNPTLKAEINRLEDQSLLRQGVTLPELTEFETHSVKICDLAEMAEFGQHERDLGSRFGQPIIDVTTRAVKDMLPLFHHEDQTNIRNYFLKSLGVLL